MSPGKRSASSAKSLLDKLIDEAPFAVRGIQVDGGAEFKSVFEAECQARGLELFVLPPKRPDLNGCVERAHRPGATSSTPHTTCPAVSISSRPLSTPSPTDSTTTGRTTLLPDKPQQSISKLSAKATLRRLTCSEPGHLLTHITPPGISRALRPFAATRGGVAQQARAEES